MPEISRFEGIVITMYYREHSPPHFHAEYGGVEALFDLNEGAFTKGALPSKQARLVLAWYELHRRELLQMWDSKIFGKIKPLS
ncbi:MAG: DUF4160 domain-containing protein [Oscillospiraceae bacterium]|jgi:hypothetical protein|nr:DUF4160 domain-containing protein [Oscillospiraceae bacterium]